MMILLIVYLLFSWNDNSSLSNDYKTETLKIINNLSQLQKISLKFDIKKIFFNYIYNIAQKQQYINLFSCIGVNKINNSTININFYWNYNKKKIKSIINLLSTDITFIIKNNDIGKIYYPNNNKKKIIIKSLLQSRYLKLKNNDTFSLKENNLDLILDILQQKWNKLSYDFNQLNIEYLGSIESYNVFQIYDKTYNIYLILLQKTIYSIVIQKKKYGFHNIIINCNICNNKHDKLK